MYTVSTCIIFLFCSLSSAKCQTTPTTDTKLAKKNSAAGNNIYNPASSSYHPVDDACWKRGQKLVHNYTVNNYWYM